MFVAQLANAADSALVEQLGMIPARVLDPDLRILLPGVEEVHGPFGTRLREAMHEAAPAAVPAWLTPLTCIFLHGGWLHIIGNLWFLWIFGDNVEDRFGHRGYLLFYLAAGVGASLVHLITNPGSEIPTVGASGAIAGVMGAYFYLYPRAMVLTAIPLFFILYTLVLPAPIFLGIWFLMQLLQGSFALGGSVAGGVAWWAHIGGFVVGLGTAIAMGRAHVLRPRVEVVRPNSQHVGLFRGPYRSRGFD
jgi:membrane associated rhomboid family serine protease